MERRNARATDWVEAPETRREPIRGGSNAASMPHTVSETSTQSSP